MLSYGYFRVTSSFFAFNPRSSVVGLKSDSSSLLGYLQIETLDALVLHVEVPLRRGKTRKWFPTSSKIRGNR